MSVNAAKLVELITGRMQKGLAPLLTRVKALEAKSDKSDELERRVVELERRAASAEVRLGVAEARANRDHS